MTKVYIASTKLGKYAIAENNGTITNLLFNTEVLPDGFTIAETPLLRNAANQLNEYLSGERLYFDLPLMPSGTPFMKSVWERLLAIPYGQTRTYGQISVEIGKPNAARAVGLANNRNPIPIFIPCHRVIGHNGKLTGYAGGLDMKETLLNIEYTYKA